VPGSKGTLVYVAAYDHTDGIGGPVFSNSVPVIYP
jgi:hypothetical protein